MAQSYQESPKPTAQQYTVGQPSFATPYSPSAPAEFPIPPPQYSVVDPALQQPQPHTTFIQHQQPVVQQQHVVVLQIPIERHPINTVCPSCHSSIVTKVKTEPNAVTHLMAGILCFLCWLPCVCLPYCITSCQSSVHYCPNCAAYIGSYRFGRRY